MNNSSIRCMRMRSLSLAGLLARYTPARATQSNAHWRLIDRALSARSSISTIRRAHLPTSALKSRSTVSCPILACSFLDLALARRLGVEPHARVESLRPGSQKLLLPGVNLVRWTSWRSAKSATVACSRKALGDLRLHSSPSCPSILRLVFWSWFAPSIMTERSYLQLSRWS